MLTLSGHLCDGLDAPSGGACGCVCVCLCSQLYAGSGLPADRNMHVQLSAQAPDAGVFLPRRSLNLGAAAPAQRSFLLTKQSLCLAHI